MREGAVVETPAVPGGPPASQESTIGRALGMLGDSWTLLILQRAFLGVRRFATWRDELGISDSVLAGRLRDLTAAGLLAPHPYRDGGRTRREYRLTDRGLELWALLVAIWSWERAWVPREAPLPDLVHVGCSRDTDVVLLCGGCGEPVTAHDTVATMLPGASFTTVAPPRAHPRRSRGTLPTDPLSWFPGTVEVLGDRWGTCVLAAALLGIRSFSAFQRELEISPDVLTDRLRRLVEHDVLTAGRGGYRLTDKGRATFAMFMLLQAWADRHLADATLRPAVRIEHRGCGARLDPRLACRACRAVLGRRDVTWAPRER